VVCRASVLYTRASDFVLEAYDETCSAHISFILSLLWRPIWHELRLVPCQPWLGGNSRLNSSDHGNLAPSNGVSSSFCSATSHSFITRRRSSPVFSLTSHLRTWHSASTSICCCSVKAANACLVLSPQSADTHDGNGSIACTRGPY